MKVFVSSTFKDLEQHRAVVNDALQRMRTEFSAMEFFGSRTDAAVEICRKEIADCDIMIGIYAWRYGWQPPPDLPSITELEFDFAGEMGKKRLCYLMHDEHPWPPSRIDKGASAEHLANFKDRVGRTLVVSRFTTPDNLATQIVADLGREMAQVRRPAPSAGIELEQFSDEVIFGLWKAARTRREGNTLVSLREVLAVLSEHPSPTRSSNAAQSAGASSASFVGRKEYFGSLVYDRKRDDYIPFDEEATKIFQRAQQQSASSMLASIADARLRGHFEQFVQLCAEVGLIDTHGFAAWPFVADRSALRYLSAPALLYLACTHACNFSCAHCFSSSGRTGVGELTTSEILALIDQMADLGCFRLSLGGGEPLLRADLPQIISHANRCGVSIEISTNAAAATSEVVQSLKDKKIAQLNVSMDAADSSLYDQIRGQTGAFETAMRGLEELSTLTVPITFRIVLRRSNTNQIRPLAELGRRYRVIGLTLRAMKPVGRAAQIEQ